MNDKSITLIKGSTRTRIQISLAHPYTMHLREMFKVILSDYEYNKRTRSIELMNRYYTYDMRTNEFLIPAAYTNDVINLLDELMPVYEIKEEDLVQGRDVTFDMNPDFTPLPNQIDAINYLASENPPYNKGLSLMTGGGKTVVAIAAIAKRKKAAMIITSGLTEQWYQSFQRFTNIGKRLVIVQGIQSLLHLLDQDEKPDVIIFSLETLRLYVNRAENYRELPSYERFISYFGIDTKIVDECHLNFKANTIFDLHSNLKNNIYLTATFTSSNKQTRKIFNRIYPVSIRYGANVRDKYIDVYSYGYNYFVPPKCYTRLRGYTHHGYEKYFLKRITKLAWFFDSVLTPLINSHYDLKCKPGQRCLIFFSSLNMIMAAKEYLTKKYPNRKVGIYIGESEDMAYNKYEIIISNAKKAGTGTDIKELYTVINTISFASETMTEQMLGRLRKLPDGTTPEYIEVYNTTCLPHLKHRKIRRDIYYRLAHAYHDHMIP